jgi:polyhydroxybutyrate depolymerase
MLASLIFACGGDPAPEPLETSFGGSRPVELAVPADYDAASPAPLLIVLHGHSVNGAVQLAYTRLGDLVDSHGFLVMGPDGLVNEEGNHYWNATNACCDFYDSGVDDAGYIRGLIDEVSAEYSVDPKRIFLWGHSNGGFMSYRMACDYSETIAGIVSLAGATHFDPSDCGATEPVNILQIHGELDSTVPFAGVEQFEGGEPVPGVEATLAQWVALNGCSDTRTVLSDRLDLDRAVEGDDTRMDTQDGCSAGGSVDLWVIEGGEHIPGLRPNFDNLMADWFSAHAKP